MIRVWVQLARGNVELSTAEAVSAGRALGGRLSLASEDSVPEGCVEFDLPSPESAVKLAERLALSRRCLTPWPRMTVEAAAQMFQQRGRSRGSASFRLWPGGGKDRNDQLHRMAGAFRQGGGRIDLSAPQSRYVILGQGSRAFRVAEELSRFDRAAATVRRMPNLPFRRPVSLPVTLARAAANLAEIRPGDWVVDPFAGTGALAAEAGVLGGRVSLGDRSPEMIRGALRNLSHLGIAVEQARVGDAGDPFAPPHAERWDALLTDPPYGRSSALGGETARELLTRTLPRWVPWLKPGGRLVVIAPAGGSTEIPGLALEETIRDRVHRSLTREFRKYRAPD